MSSHARDVLELRDALDVVAGFAASGLGGAAVRALEPGTALEAVRYEIALVGEGMGLLADDGWAMPAVPDLREPLTRLPLEGYSWDGPHLRAAAQLIHASRSVQRFVASHAGTLPRLTSIAEALSDFPGAAESIERAIDDDGEVRDNASPELRSIRGEIQGARSRIVARLSEYAASLPTHYQVPDASVSVRDGRYVVPVRREGRGEVGGIVHGESQTGATLFIEPPVAISMMNRLRELEAAEQREVHRILRELTGSLRPHADALVGALEALVRLDTVYARARYAASVRAHPPEIVAVEGSGLVVVAGRHPLLLAQGAEVVPFDLEMEPGERTLVISGPNTGGKTVLLKAIGLLTLLARCGVVPPVARGTRLPLFSQVYADIGDEQSIEASLSTFSGHLRNLRSALEGADAESLVLIDEIGSGTDPVEGAALAQAIILELTRRSAFTVATTHLGALKLLSTEDERVVNASLQFDAERLEPTYRLLKGLPGRSYGLAIARRLGLPAAVLEEAEAALPEGERDVGRLLLELEAKEQRLADLNADLDLELARTRKLTGQLEERERALAQRQQDAERRTRQQARDILMRSREEVEEAIRQVREAADSEKLEDAARAARRRVEEAAARQRDRAPQRKKRAPARATSEPPRVGARVRIESLGRTGTLLEVRDDRATVDAGGLRMQVPAADLEMLPEGDQAPEANAAKPRPRGSRGHHNVAVEARPEIDLRGLRVDELEIRLGRGLDDALVAGLPSFRIIHGKGTGALRARVQEILATDPRVASFRPGDRFEGGTGVTVAEFS